MVIIISGFSLLYLLLFIYLFSVIAKFDIYCKPSCKQFSIREHINAATVA